MHRDMELGGIHFVLDASDHLEPCPFCGSTDLEMSNVNNARYWIECKTCEARAEGKAQRYGRRIEPHRLAAASAIEIWNHRTTFGPLEHPGPGRTGVHVTIEFDRPLDDDESLAVTNMILAAAGVVVQKAKERGEELELSSEQQGEAFRLKLAPAGA